MYQNDALKVLTGKVRLSYAHLTEPYAHGGVGEPKYSVTLLIPKSDAATKADIDQSIQAAIEEGRSNSWKGVVPPQVKTPIHDGDGVRPSGEPYGGECKGHWVITASSKLKPQVVDISNINCELSPSDIYSGMYARVTIRFFAYANNGNKGIGCGLGNVLKIEDGEPLSGHSTAASDFADVAPAAPAYAPPQTYTAPQPSTYAPQAQQPPVTGINPITGQPYGN